MQIIHIHPTQGSARGGELVRLVGVGFPRDVRVAFGPAPAQVLAVAPDGRTLEVRTPEHPAALVDVIVTAPSAGESCVKARAFAYLRPQLTYESDLTRLVRSLLQLIKRQILRNTGLTVSIDYRGLAADGGHAVELAKLPALVLTGPRLRENRLYSDPQLRAVNAAGEDEATLYRPAYTVDLLFSLTGASQSTVELLNLLAAVTSFLHLNRWIELPRTPDSADIVRWEMDPDGEVHTQLDGPDDIRAFSCAFVIRGFDIDPGAPYQAAHDAPTVNIHTHPLEGKALE